MRLVVDCLVSVAWYVEDESNAYTERALAEVLRHGAHVPCLWRIEFVNAILMAERRKRIGSDTRVKVVRDAETLPLALDSDPPALNDLAALAAAHGLTAYDAVYVELAQRLSLPLATQDKDLIKAATDMGVALFK
jgi:predicted nucleic acid-binding protein